MKASGTGRSHGLAGLMECVQTKTIVAERLPGVAQVWWGGGGGHAGGLDAFLGLVHGRGARQRFGGVGRLARLIGGLRGRGGER